MRYRPGQVLLSDYFNRKARKECAKKRKEKFIL
jgi:hypothetical protein